MTYTVSFKLQFAKEFAVFPTDQQTAVAEFIEIYQEHGLANQTKYPGRVSPSWHGLPTNHPNYQYTQSNELWHYHVGLPKYAGQAAWGRVSDWVLHFQWPARGSHISLVDLYQHYMRDGSFYLPSPASLEEHPAVPSVNPQS